MANRYVPVMLAIACLVILHRFPGYRTVLSGVQNKVVIAGDAGAHALTVDSSSTQPNMSFADMRSSLLPTAHTAMQRMVWRVLVFSAKPYDKSWLDKGNNFTASDTYLVDLQYAEEGLSITTVSKARGFDVVCLCVNDVADQKVIDQLFEFHVKMIALRCAGHDKVDSTYAASKGIVVVHVPEYSPAAVAEHGTQPNISFADIRSSLLPTAHTAPQRMVWRVLVFSTKPYDKSWLDKENDFTASDKYLVDLQYAEEGLSITTVSKARGFDVVCLFVNDVADQKVIDQLFEFRVKMIALRCAGHDKVNSTHATSKGIVVVRVPEYSPASVAEHTVALMMSVARHLPQAVARTERYNFDIQNLNGFTMKGKTVGFIGTGKIGGLVVEILTGFKCKLIAWTPGRHHDALLKLGLTYVSLDELWVQSDIITLHVGDIITRDGLKTKQIINRESIEKMRKQPMIINTGRGSLIDTEALLNGLEAKKISSAGLDVYERESGMFFSNFSTRREQVTDNTLKQLLAHPRVQVTAHLAFFTNEALDAIAKETINSIRCMFEGRQLDTKVILPEVRIDRAAPTNGTSSSRRTPIEQVGRAHKGPAGSSKAEEGFQENQGGLSGTSFLNLWDTNWEHSADHIDALELL